MIKHTTALILSLVIAGAISFSSCKKKENPDPNDPGNGNTNPPTGKFMFHLHTYIDHNEVDLYDIPYTALDGRTLSLSLAQLYISDIQLVRLDGSIHNFSGKKVLKVLESQVYIVGDVPVGNYKSLRFKVGLDPASNMTNPLTSPDSAILNRPAMWFGSTAQPDGYVFMNVQGKIDTSADMTGALVPFVYKIGTNANYKQVTMPDKNLSIVKDQVEYGHIMIDYYRLFKGVKLNENGNLSVTTAAQNSSAPATIIANNIPSMFIYEP